MLATILVEPGRTELVEIARPTPDRGEVLVKIKAALTCGTDLKAFKRGHPVIPMPGVFGHEFSGVVAETGKGIKKFREGDEIMSVHSAPCLECRYCRKNLFHLCEPHDHIFATAETRQQLTTDYHRLENIIKPDYDLLAYALQD